MRHIISPLDFSVEELNELMDTAADIEKNPDKYANVCNRKKLATLFYEPSTRTRLSLETAMLNLGGQIIGFASSNASSAAKGESVADTIRMISCYADIAAIRHPKEGAALVAAMNSSIPVINAGDGGHQHPTQTLTDLLTIRSLKGRLSNLTVGLCGDLKFGRTVHSLINALVRYPGIRFVLISPTELRIPSYIRENVLDANHVEYEEIETIFLTTSLQYSYLSSTIVKEFAAYGGDISRFVPAQLIDRIYKKYGIETGMKKGEHHHEQ